MERVKKKMEDARKQRDTLQHNHSQTTDDLCDDKKSKSILSKNMKRLTLQANSFCFLLGMAVVIAAVIVAWRLMLEKWPENNPGSSTVEIAAYQAGGSAELQVLASENNKLKEDIAYLNERLMRLTDSAAHLENKLEPPAAGKTDSAAASDKIAPKPSTADVAASKPAAKSTGTGAWVINLVSLTSQADADQFSARARSKGVHTEQQNVTVKGKKYWRVQITGFVTSEEAKSYSNSAKQKLGLKDVWITKR